MNIARLSLGIAMAATVCFGGSGLALARSGASAPVYSCPPPGPPGAPPAAPGLGEVYLYSLPDYSGTCWAIRVIQPGVEEWAGYEDGDAGFRNDDIMSMRVGLNVRFVGFWDSFGTASHFWAQRIGPNTAISSLGSWANVISAIRLESVIPGTERCGASADNKIVIWDTTAEMPTTAYDCTVLSVAASSGYPTPASMAFRNDAISAFQVPGYITREVWAHYDANYWSRLFKFLSLPCHDIDNLWGCGPAYSICGDGEQHNCTTWNAGDRISSISVN